MSKQMSTAVSEHHALDVLLPRAIDPASASRIGVHSVTTEDELPKPFQGSRYATVPGLVFPWHSPSGEVVLQYRPDVPSLNDDGDPVKYLFPAGTEMVLTELREPSKAKDAPMLLQEGTCQAISASLYAPNGWAVYGMSGCWSWRKGETQVAIPDLSVAEGRDVVISLDADAGTNLNVYNAGLALKEALLAEGAHSVRFLRLAGHGKKAGLDDVLGSRAEDRRAPYLARLIERASDKPADARPKEKRSAAKPRLTVDRSGDRPLIVVTEDKLAVINEVQAALADRWNGDHLFTFGDVLAWREDRTMEPVNDGTLMDLLASAAQTVALNAKNEAVSAWPDEGCRKAILNGRRRSFTPLDRVTETPFIRPDGTVCQRSGYDEPTRTFLVLDEAAEQVHIPDEPSEEDVESAVKLLTVDWLGDLMDSMPEAADRANALALVLTPLVRGLVPLAPLAVIDGLQMGVGKNLLADLVTIFATGRSAKPLPFSGEDEENRKVITSVFRSGADIFVFDEAHNIGGRQLARAITGETYSDRILGVSTMAEFPNRTTWIALGNNVTVEGDLARRVFRIRLAPPVANPQDRDAASFRHPDIKEWTRENRAELLAAGLTLVRAWMIGERELSPAGRSFGSFERWGGMVGGILENAGVGGFLTNLREWRAEADYDSTYWTAHFGWLDTSFGERDFSVGEVVEKMARARKGSVEHPPRLTDHDATGYNRLLGQAYGRMKGRTFGGLTLVKVVGGTHGARWKLVTIGEAGVNSVSPNSSPDTDSDDSSQQTADSSDSSDSSVSATHEETSRAPSREARPRISVTESRKAIYPMYPTYPPADVSALSRFVTERAAAVEIPECPDCDIPEELTPSGFWYACRVCHPETFASLAH